MQNIPMDLLRTFVKAIESGSLTRAGGLVGRSQSAVSLQIRRLEDLVGVPPDEVAFLIAYIGNDMIP